ncbi:GCN5 family N-acetyltransferase [Anaerocolumna cellulosilytica]|uniref:GCN5 family N-acetyltransferase n=1 Tax=Anaerocolumna cellulosilytica TaxID=433286 RepID=A0A6S6R762_9FIRM|nr:GNAT family N-acetyltransferase [Anaerocolumna cellulosilytica]MBB5197580.1 ribosomal protein S18 acetylase RimI-like enzyme [Anaerocolumna cellulosilytica]BCJ95105.1 GCN5 family N-acetyltransferase [Anaerocolumna cellulosilytica]
MRIRNIEPEEDAGRLLAMQFQLDLETIYMMLEPGERDDSKEKLESRLRGAVSNGSIILVAETSEKEIIGYIWAERGIPRRIRHSAYIVTGIRKSYRGRGIGTSLFKELEKQAKEKGITRLELTVIKENIPALNLYQKMGYRIEGEKPESLFIEGRFLDEYYMGKLIIKDEPAN